MHSMPNFFKELARVTVQNNSPSQNEKLSESFSLSNYSLSDLAERDRLIKRAKNRARQQEFRNRKRNGSSDDEAIDIHGSIAAAAFGKTYDNMRSLMLFIEDPTSKQFFYQEVEDMAPGSSMQIQDEEVNLAESIGFAMDSTESGEVDPSVFSDAIVSDSTDLIPEGAEPVIEHAEITQERQPSKRGRKPGVIAQKGLSESDRRNFYIRAEQRQDFIDLRNRKSSDSEAIKSYGQTLENLGFATTQLIISDRSTTGENEVGAQDQSGLSHDETWIGNGACLDFAIAMLLTAAEDIVYSRSEIERHEKEQHLSEDRLGKIQFMLDAAEAWLDGFDGCEFTYYQCVELFRDELRLYSNGQVPVPDFSEMRDVIADWILDAPEQAVEMLSRYKTLFGSQNHAESQEEENVDETAYYEQVEDEPPAEKRRERYRV